MGYGYLLPPGGSYACLLNVVKNLVLTKSGNRYSLEKSKLRDYNKKPDFSHKYYILVN